MERYKEGETGKRKSKAPEFKFETPKFKPKKTTIDLPSIESLPKEHYARVYCEGREIPQQFMNKIFYAEDFKEWAISVCQVDYSNLMGKEPRLVIPFFDKDNQLIGAQGRALQDSKIRYVTVKVHENSPKVFGLERWNSDQHTYLVEGPIDSLFLPNCLAMAGADMSDLSILNKDKTTLIFDNEPRNKEIIKRMYDVIEKDYNLVVWPNDMRHKDINDMIISGMSIAEVQTIISKNTFAKLEALTKLSYYKKC